jgi:y4mF family transcriptional regulator
MPTPALDLPERLAAFVRAERKANGLSQTRLALLAHVGRRLVRDIEDGKPTVQLDKVQAVLAVFGHTLHLAVSRPADPPAEPDHV